MTDFDLSEFRDLFVEEGHNYLQTLNTNLLALERDPDDAQALEAMFRAAHSLKGGAATMGYSVVGDLAHATEDALDKLGRGRWQLTPPLAQLLFDALDRLQELLADVAADRESTADASMLERLRASEPPATSEPEVAPFPTPPADEFGEPMAPTSIVRVDVHYLDSLLDVVSEMVIHRSLLCQLGQRYELVALSEALQVHDRLLTRLRNAVLGMRMVPVSQVFDRFPRMIRDLLKAQGKRAQFVIGGGRVEMDRSVLEALNDPLVHLIRNAIGHGLETPAERAKAAKSRTARLRLTARRERESVVIVLEDDGRGMDSVQIAAAAVDQGLITEEAVAEMSAGQILQLLCHPGFSTSREVTAVSGRGVGMTVVKRAVEALRGTLEIETQVGQGSTFRLRLPVMLTLLDAMLVRVGEEQYALPVAQVEHILEIEPAQIECIGGREVMMVDDAMLPLRRMSRLLHVPNADPNPRYALIVRPKGEAVGLRVDAVLGREEIVARSVPVALRSIPALVGVTVMGEGQTVLILDVEEALGEPGITGFPSGRQVGSSDL